MVSPRLRCRGWHLRRLVWALLSDLRSPDGLGTRVQVQVGEVSPVALQAFLPGRNGVEVQSFKGAVLGDPKVDPFPSSTPCPLLPGHQLSWRLGLLLAPLPWPLRPRDRHRACHLQSHRCLGWCEPLGRADALHTEARPGSPNRWAVLQQSQSPPLPPLGSEDTRPFVQPAWGQGCGTCIYPYPGP